jgi:hypothetical protein
LVRIGSATMNDMNELMELGADLARIHSGPCAAANGTHLTRQQAEWLKSCEAIVAECVAQARGYVVQVRRVREAHPYGSTVAVEELFETYLDCDAVTIDGPLSEIDAAPLNFTRDVTVDGVTVALRFRFIGTVIVRDCEHGLCYEVEVVD